MDSSSSSSSSSSKMQPKPLVELLSELGDAFVTRKKTSRSPDTIMKPMTLAELEKALSVINSRVSPPQQEKPAWNNSSKVDYGTKGCTSEGQIKKKSAKKFLNFKSKTRSPNLRTTVTNTETPKHKNPTPVEMSLDIPRKTTVDIPISPNMSFKSCDTSFLQKEKEINDVKEKMLVEKVFLENIANISQPDSTPFKENRNVKDFLNNSDENSILYNDSTELSILLGMKKKTENSINMIKTSISTLQNVQEAEENSLQYIIKLINKKSAKTMSETENDTTVLGVKETEVKMKQKSPILRALGIKIKSPSSKIIKKN